MKEFLLLIRNESDHKESWTEERHQQFLQKCEEYIGKLTNQEKLISAQPLVRQGYLVSGRDGAWEQAPYTQGKEVIVGYYHIRAESMEEAIDIAKANPEFDYGETAKIEVRPIKIRENSTGFVYPSATQQMQ